MRQAMEILQNFEQFSRYFFNGFKTCVNMLASFYGRKTKIRSLLQKAKNLERN